MVSAQEALALASQNQQAMNNSRYVPEMPDIFREVSEKNRMYIFNVGPWAHVRELGSCGAYRIPACLDGKEHSEPVVIQGVEQEPYPIGPTEMAMIPKSGKAGVERGGGEGLLLANQILGEGPMIPKSSSFRPFGVFVSPTEKPSKDLLVRAQVALQNKYLELVAEANAAYAKGPQAARETINSDWHFVAARALKKTAAECPWMRDTEMPAKREECPGCGEVYAVGIMRHKCGYILDKKRFDEAKAQGLIS